MWIIKIVDSTATNTWWLGSSAMRIDEGYVHGLLSGDIEIHNELDVFTKQYSTPDVTLEFTNAPYKNNVRLSDEWLSIKNADVIIYQYLGGSTSASIADCLQVFTGFVPFGPSVADGRISLRVIASSLRALPMTVPTTQIIDIYPAADESLRDKYLPIIYGEFIWNTRGEEYSRKNNALVECIQITKQAKPTFAIADHAVATPTKVYTKVDDELFEYVLTDWTYTASDSSYLSKPTLVPIAGKIMPFKEIPLEVVHPREFMNESAWNASPLGLVNTVDPLNKLPSTGYLSTDYSIDSQVVIYDSYDDGGDQYGLAYAIPLQSINHKQFAQPVEWGVLLYAGADTKFKQEFIRATWNVVRGVPRNLPPGSHQLLYDNSFAIDTVLTSNNGWEEPTFVEYQAFSDVTFGVAPPYGETGYNYSSVIPLLEITIRQWRGAIRDGVKNNTPVGGIYEARFACKYNVPIDNLWIACGGKPFGSWIDEAGRSNVFSAGDAIRSPIYVIESLLRDYAGLTSSEIDTDSFDAANTDTGQDVVLHTKQQHINFVINEPKPVTDIVKEILEETWIAIVETPFGKLKALNLWNTNPTVTRTIPVSHIVAEYPGGPPKMELSKSTFNVPQINVSVTEETLEITRPKFAGNTLIKKMKFIKGDYVFGEDPAQAWDGAWPHLTNQSAINYADFLLGSKEQGAGFWSQEHTIIEFETIGGTNADLQVGDYISIDAGMDYILKCYGQSWNSKAFFVTAVTNLLDRTRLKCIEMYTHSTIVPTGAFSGAAYADFIGPLPILPTAISGNAYAEDPVIPQLVSEEILARAVHPWYTNIYLGAQRGGA